jgi:hypothetical protein
LSCSNVDDLIIRMSVLQRRIDDLSYEVDKILLCLSRFDEEFRGEKK